jgi:hypothetical protein
MNCLKLSPFMHIVALCETDITDLIREGLLSVICMEVFIMQFNSSSIVLNFTAYTRHVVCLQI